MARFILNRITLLFLLLFAVGVSGALAYQAFYVEPAKKCEAAGNWWAERWRACATPIKIEQLTGRPNPTAPPAGPPAPAAKP